ncbi:glycosyltransferase family 2 protein [Gordonia sp. ABSL49_1]|uniref:glycosyltransferase family 2 protein n=1 Tax=Gordonia sp. ABSL49_1 TaxID=2920941 RepID=UPI001F0E6268|nr:glycosyltransferase family 2 protein [Gordonia sp. ABSL49_1]MCH5643940.1 glycosyltransferase family 2 protein [Gordonia sp. ABSL49_1]
MRLPHRDVSVIVPTRNEAKNLPYVAKRMPDGIAEIIVVDGGSTDGTLDVARSLWPHARLIQQTRKGKGNALACGFAAAKGEIIVMIDADGSTDAAEIPMFVQALCDGADFAKGSRFTYRGGSSDITRLRRLGNLGLNGIVNHLYSARFTDLCYGYNAFWRHCLPIIDMPDPALTEAQWGDGFEVETLMNIRVARSGLKIAEVASYERDRIHGESNLNAVSDGIRVLRTIFDERVAVEKTAEPAPATPNRVGAMRVRLGRAIAGTDNLEVAGAA